MRGSGSPRRAPWRASARHAPHSTAARRTRTWRERGERIVFEIRSRMREARERRGLELADVEHDTRILARWLKALEGGTLRPTPGARVRDRLSAHLCPLSRPGTDSSSSMSSRPAFPRGSARRSSPPAAARRRKALRPQILAGVGVAAVALIGRRPTGHLIAISPSLPAICDPEHVTTVANLWVRVRGARWAAPGSSVV
jgi:Helix-turn-helix domain